MAKSMTQVSKEFKRRLIKHLGKSVNNIDFYSSPDDELKVYDHFTGSLNHEHCRETYLSITFYEERHLGMPTHISIAPISGSLGREKCLEILGLIKHNFPIH